MEKGTLDEIWRVTIAVKKSVEVVTLLVQIEFDRLGVTRLRRPYWPRARVLARTIMRNAVDSMCEKYDSFTLTC